MNDLEKLLTASLQIERLKTEVKLGADAISALRETLLARDAEIVQLCSQLSPPFKRDRTAPALLMRQAE